MGKGLVSMSEPVNLSPDIRDQWLDFVTFVFTGASKDYFIKHLDNDDREIYKGAFVITENGNIIATARVMERYIIIKKKTVAEGAIGEVSVAPDKRNQGLATVILRKLIDYMNSGVPKPLDNQILLSTLHTGPAAPLYRKLGWESILFEQVKYFPVAVQNSSLNFRKTEFSDNDVAVRRIFIARDLFD